MDRHSINQSRRRGPGRGPRVEPLEPRCLLATSPFASFQGEVAGQPADAIAVQVRPADFDFGPGGRVILGFALRGASGSALDPGATVVGSNRPGGVRILRQRPDSGGGTASVTLASVRPGALAIRPTGEDGTRGAYELDVYLAGDANGDRRVDARDLRAIRAALGQEADAPGVAPGADVDGSGRVDGFDLAVAGANFRASTRLRPPSLTAGVAPSDDPDGDGRVDSPRVHLVGRTTPGAVVRLDRGADGTFEAVARADSRGRYRFSVALAQGANTFQVEATDRFGQRATVRRVITRGPAAAPISLGFDFRQGAQGWQSGFADLPSSPNASFELDSGIRPLPAELGTGGTGFLLQSHNRSDDVFMFLKRRLGTAEGVRANQTYQVRFTIVLASNAPTGAVGIGGAPGESVTLKAGAGPTEPVVVAQPGGEARLNVDKGNQTVGGPAASVVGNIANGQDPVGPGGEQPYVSLTRTHTHTFNVRADSNGNLWLLVGTDSGFEGLTAVYFQRIDVQLTPVNV